jgi:uncharacterized protein YbbK (DUF523 family)
MIIVSACLAGIKCRYDGLDNTFEKVVELVSKGEAIPVCPEQLGGLSTPRLPAEIKEDKVININGEDVTENYLKGARETLQIARMTKSNQAILKQRSPSCGCGLIYDGTHSGKIVPGIGLTAKLLLDNGISVKTEEDI